MSARKPYHHDNLRNTLLDQAIRLIGEVGPVALTLREIARRAGVSHNAPYRHFRDRDDLLAAVAAQGYRELTEAMLAAAKRESHPVERLKSAGLAYVSFALRRPEHFTVIFDAPVPQRAHPGTTAAAERAFSTLQALVKACQDAGQLPAIDSLQLALLAWTMVHGIAKLAITGRLPFHSHKAVLTFAEFVIDRSLPIGR